MKRITSLFGKEFHIPKFRGIANVIKSFSLTEKVIFGVFALIFIGASLSMFMKVNSHFMVEIPRYGGTYREGTIGTPRFINPLLALSETDRDLTALIYSGLMRQAPDGTLVPDLAEKVEVSEDEMSYAFTIRNDAVFHDGEPVTADDAIFTVMTAQDTVIKSAKRANWDGITIEKAGEKEVIFHLQQPYAPFLNNTTLGILPKHIWQGVSAEEFTFSQFNIAPIGSGPYKVREVEHDKSGIATMYKLVRFNDFALGKPYMKNVYISFYRNEEDILRALREGEIEAVNSISPENAAEFEAEHNVTNLPLPRVFAVFFNQSKAPVLIHAPVRKALDMAVDRQKIIDEVLSGFATPIHSPIPASLNSNDTQTENSARIEEAKAVLADAGWKQDEAGIWTKGSEKLAFSISTADIPELIAVAERVTATWKELGADVSVKVFSANDLNQNVIRPRRYDALLFGQIIGRDMDFYAFWHSSQRADPGLNVADYANIKVDQALAQARGVGSSPEQAEALATFEETIIADTPAAFLYSPDFIYIVPKAQRGDIPSGITVPSDRFSNIHQWYLETDTVWRIFS